MRLLINLLNSCFTSVDIRVKNDKKNGKLSLLVGGGQPLNVIDKLLFKALVLFTPP